MNSLSPTSSSPALRGRYPRVMRFFIGTAIGVVWWELVLRRIGLRSLARRTAPRRYQRIARRYRGMAARLGGVWIKVGQFLSARVDILPQEITRELEGLQDEVAPEAFSAMRSTIETEFDSPLNQLFHHFEDQPLASASLGQVHRAKLTDGSGVVVKVQRPAIEQIVEIDLRALGVVLGWLKRYRAIRRRADLDALLEEFSRTLWAELDYLAEAANAERFQEMFAGDAHVRIPAVYRQHTTRRVLTLEDVYQIKITDYDAIQRAGVERPEVADRLFKTYLRQIFEEGFFHADPHPGNLFVQPESAGEWRLVFVDFGMVGLLEPSAKAGLRDLAVAVGTRDVDRMALAYQQLGVLLPGADLERIKQASAEVLDRSWGKNMTELIRTHPAEMRQVSAEFRDLLYEMPFQVPTNLIFLGRCVAILSGMCTGLDPEFNLFAGLQPYARRLLLEEGDGGGLDWLLDLLRQLAAIPGRMEGVLGQIERGDLRVRAEAGPLLSAQLGGLTRAINRLTAAVVLLGLLGAGTALWLLSERLPGAVLFALAALLSLLLLFPRRGARR